MSSNPSISITAKIREVGVHSAVYGLGSVAQSAVQFLLIPVLTAAWVTSEFGAYSLIQMTSVIAGSIFYLGMTSALPRSYFDYTEDDDRRSVFTTAFLLLLAGALAQIAFGQFAGRLLSSLLFQTARYHGPIFWAFLGSALAFVNQFFFAYIRFLRHSVTSVVLSILALAGSMGGSVALLRLGSNDLSAPFQGIACAQGLVLLAFVLLYGRRAFTRNINGGEILVLLKFGVPTIFVSVGSLAIDWADRILIERMLSLHDVGVYSVGYKLGSIVNAFVITPFTQIWNPMMFEYRSHANIGGFFSRVVSYYFLFSSTILIVTCFFIREGLPVAARSASYHGAAPVTLLVMAGYLLNGASNIVSAGLFYERKIHMLVAIYYAIAIANIVVNIYAIPRFGINGAAGVSLLTYAAIPVVVYVRARKYFAIRFEIWRLLRIALIVSVALCFGLFIDPRYQPQLSVKLVLCLAVLGIAALSCTDESEKRIVLRLLKRRLSEQPAPTR